MVNELGIKMLKVMYLAGRRNAISPAVAEARHFDLLMETYQRQFIHGSMPVDTMLDSYENYLESLVKIGKAAQTVLNAEKSMGKFLETI